MSVMSESEYEEYAYSSDEEGFPVDTDDEDMDWDVNPNAPPTTKPKSPGLVPSTPKSGIRLLQADELRFEMRQRVEEVADVLNVSMAAAGVLLRANHWSKEALLEDYMSQADQVLKRSGVYCRCGHPQEPTDLTNCSICYDDEAEMMRHMDCGHAFCTDCWYDYCKNAVEDGPVCVSTTCPQAECNEVVTEQEMKDSLGNSPLLAKYLTYQLRSYVDANPLTRWCPGRGCERVAAASSTAVLEAEGSVAHCDACSTSFCVPCGEEPHAPATCKDLGRWNEKCRNESETANWILANTKKCPICSSRIEKNQGCNHMTCQRCKHEFCWICMGEWAQHGSNTGGFYKCNRFDNPSEGDPNDMSNAAKAKRDLDRYLHYYKRFHAHQEAESFAQKQLKETEARMIVLQESSESKWADVEFLKAANEQLVECRRVLKYTYVFAYYLDAELTMQRVRFEHHQEMLERFTENLSELSEKPLAEMDRTDVVNQTRVVDRFMKNILKYVEDGMEDV